MEIVKRKTISPKHRMRLFKAQKGKCFYCGFECKYPSDMIGEHKVPLSRGGTNDKENYVLSCYVCDITKGNKTADEFISIIANDPNFIPSWRKILGEKELTQIKVNRKQFNVFKDSTFFKRIVSPKQRKLRINRHKEPQEYLADELLPESTPAWVRTKVERYWKQKLA